MSDKHNEYGISALIETAHTTAREKGWWDRPVDVGVHFMLMVSELAEAMEEHRKGKPPTEIYYNGAKPEGIPIELADVLIRIFDFCGYHKIDLSQALKEKIEYNKTRSYRHGNKIA